MSAVIGALRAVLSLDSAAFDRGVKDAQGAMRGLRASMRNIGGGLQAAGAAMTAASAGFAYAIKGQIDAADQMGETAQKLGVPVESLSALKHAAEMSGVTFESLGTGLKVLSRNMAAAGDGNEAAAALFDGLGVSVTNADGSLRATETVLTDVSEVLSRMPDGAEKTALAMQIFGKSGADLVPLLNQGQTAIERMTEEARSMGLVISDETAAAAGDFNDNLDRVTKTIGGLVTQLAADLAPSMKAVSDKIVELTSWFRDLSPEVREAAAKFAAVAMVAGPVAFGLGIAASAFSSIAAAVALLNTALLANPFVRVGAAAAVAAWLVYQNWDEIKAFFADIWTGIKTTATDLWESVTVMSSDAVDATLTAWTGIKESFSQKLASVTEAFQAQWESIKAEVGSWPGRFVQYGKDIVAGLVQGIKDSWGSVLDALTIGSEEAMTSFEENNQINSPSRVYRKYGGHITEGLALGITDKVPLVTGAMGEVSDAMAGSGSSLQSNMESLKSTFESAFVGFVTGATSAKDALRQLAQQLAQMLAKSAFNTLFSGLFSGGGLLGGLFADGGVFQGGKVKAFAKGGIVAGATAFAMQGGMGVMGEAGPEAIMPLKRGADGKLGVQAAQSSGGGVVQVMVSVDQSGNLRPFVQSVAGQVAVAVVEDYDRSALSDRIAQVRQDPRVKG